MIHIEFQNIRIKNVLSIGNEIEYDFRKSKGLTYVYGINKDNEGSSNGVGKSSIFSNCVILALYGKTINNTNNAYLFHRGAKWNDESFIELSLVKDSLTHYKIRTNFKTNKKRDSVLTSVILLKDGEDITKSTKNETMQFIQENIIGCSFDVFKNTIVISSSNLVNFFQMPMAIKNKYLQGIFSLDALGKAYDVSNSKLTEVKKNLKIQSDKLKYINNAVDDINNQFLTWSNEHSKIVTDIENKLKTADSNIIELKNDLTNIINSDSNITNKRESLSKLSEFKFKEISFKKKLKDLQSKKISLETDIKFNTKLLDQHSGLLNILCSDCKPTVSEYFDLQTAKDIILESKPKLEKINDNISKCEASLDKLDSVIEKIHKYNTDVINFDKSKQIKESQLATAIESKTKLEQRLKVETANNKNPFEELLNKNKKEQTDIKSVMDNISEANQYYEIVKQVFSDNGVKQLITHQIIEILNSTIHNYLRCMGADFLVYFNDNLVYNFITPTGECEYSSFSAGERKRLDLAILLSFRDVLCCSSLSTNLLVVDEILDSAIDTKGLDSLINILKNKSKKDGQSVFVISHREGLAESDMFNHKIRIEKEQGQTKLIQEI